MQMTESLQMEGAPPRRLAVDQPWYFPPLKITVLQLESSIKQKYQPDAILRMEYEKQVFTFVAEYKANWQERTFQGAISQLKSNQIEEHYPLVVLPYLSDAHLDKLAEQGISGLDLCGNGLILVPGRWLIRQGGKPNRFRIEQSLRNPYQGKASLVGRTLLQRGTYTRLDDLHSEILKRGGNISLALVSRTVQRLEEDVITIRTDESRIQLVQPEKLLDALTDAYSSARVQQVWRGKLPALEKLLPTLFFFADTRGKRATVTGIGSAVHYVSLVGTPIAQIYLHPDSDTSRLLLEAGATPTERFSNLEVYAYPDETCFFEAKRDTEGIIWASLLQTYIEMKNSQDIRLQESAQAIRESILERAHANH